VAGQLLKLRGYTLATAESCTGDCSAGESRGSRQFGIFLEAVVSYSNEAKIDLLVCRRN